MHRANLFIFLAVGIGVCHGQSATLYDDINYGGATKVVPVNNSCVNILDFNDRASSIKTDTCVSLWQDVNCGGRRVDIQPPGMDYLGNVDFNDAATAVSACCWGVQNPDTMKINVDTSQAPQLQNFGAQVKTVLELWFPFLQTLMATSAYKPWNEINVIFDPNYNGVAYASDNKIVAATGYFNDHQDDYGAFIHEMTHNLQRADYAMSRGCPGWLVEGYAEWTRRWFYEPWTAQSKPSGKNASYKNGYTDTAWLLVYVNSKITGKPVLYSLNKACQEGKYYDNIWQDLTGKSVDDLWNDMMNDPGYPWKK